MTDTEIVDYLIEQIAAHEGGVAVTLDYDDATFDYCIWIGRYYPHKQLLGSSRSFRHMIELAASGKRFD